jgi:hypothetical protein
LVVVFEDFTKFRRGAAKLSKLTGEKEKRSLSLFQLRMEFEQFEVLVRGILV